MNRRSFNSTIITLALALLFCASGRETKVFAQSQTQSSTTVNSIPTTDNLSSTGTQPAPVVTEQPQPTPKPTSTPTTTQSATPQPTTTQPTTSQPTQTAQPQPTPQT